MPRCQRGIRRVEPTIEAKDLPPELAGDALASATTPLALTPSATAPSSTVHGLVHSGPGAGAGSGAGAAAPGQWLAGLEQDARSLLLAGEPDVWNTLTHRFEAQLIRTALEITRGRRIEAAQKLGIGRNTITRKIQELKLEG